jgi:primosomal protein N' (replication factor Y) (superfamily II helicase)
MDSSGEGRHRFVEVAVNSGQPARQTFTYAVPEGMDVRLGQALFVPYGQRTLQGIVLDWSDSPEIEGVRPVEATADPVPVLDEPHRKLAGWLSATYLAPLWDCVAASLPTGYGQKSVTMVSAVDVPPLLPATPVEQKVLQYVAGKGQVPLTAIRDALGTVPMERLRKLQEHGHISVAEGLTRPTGRPKTQRRLKLLRAPSEAGVYAAELERRQRASVAARLLRLLIDTPDISLTVAREAGANPNHVRGLATEGWLEDYDARVERGPDVTALNPSLPPLRLTEDQAAAAEAIAAAPGEYLLHGVTGSGKTEVYLDLIRRTLEAGQSCIVLVPEISLTPQAIRRYGERFGDTVTVLHSDLGAGELYDQWYRIQRGDARLVIGSRSAVFAPAKNLGLIVIDEEHEWTYKQADPQPRYQTRAVAEELCRLTGATLVLGSATPDVVTYHRSEGPEITRLELTERVSPTGTGTVETTEPPHISVVDMREELRSGNRSIFSVPLAAAVRGALANQQQSILFVNRRGGARFMLCRDCGFIASCPNCEVPMGLNRADPLHPYTLCHHCGRTKPLEERCPECSSGRYRPFGAGTQRVEQEAAATFRNARVARWDSETASRKGAHEEMVGRLERKEIDIVVGTQMLAKGLDLPDMHVVGVVDADVGLGLPDYTAPERTYQLLSQVAGRAGRRNEQGRAFIQTYQPEEPAIVAAANHDYRGFYEYELTHRRHASYPPFARLARLTVRHGDEERGKAEATRMADELRARRDVAGRGDPEIRGPVPSHIRRLRGDFRWHILVRGRNPAEFLSGFKFGTRWTVDVDPAGLL